MRSSPVVYSLLVSYLTNSSSTYGLPSSTYATSHVIATESMGHYNWNQTHSNFYLDNILDASTSGQHYGFNIVKFVPEGTKLEPVALGMNYFFYLLQ